MYFNWNLPTLASLKANIKALLVKAFCLHFKKILMLPETFLIKKHHFSS